MPETSNDENDEAVSVRLDASSPISVFTVSVDGANAGRAEFIDVPDADSERIFFHTEVDAAYAGRGLGGILVREALLDSIRKNLTVVPVCPLFARYLKQHGDEFLADGGAFRMPGRPDIALVARAIRDR